MEMKMTRKCPYEECRGLDTDNYVFSSFVNIVMKLYRFRFYVCIPKRLKL